MQLCALLSLILLIENMSIAVSQLRYTLPPVYQETEGDSPASTHTSSSNSPQGIFHYTDNDSTFQSNFKLPDFERLDPIRVASELLSAAAAAENSQKTISGINLPLPFVGKPLRLELTAESRSGVSLRDRKNGTREPSKDLNPEAREAFTRAKQICLHSSASSCDEALDTFHRLKFGSSLMTPPSSSHLLDNDPSTSIAKLFVPALEDRMEDLEKKITTEEITTEASEVDSTSRESDEEDEVRSYHEEDPPRPHPFSSIRIPIIAQNSNRRRTQTSLRRIRRT